MSTIKVDTIATRTGSGNITASNTIAGTSATLSGTLGVTGTSTLSGNATVGGSLVVTGQTTLATHLNMGDNDKIKLGASADLQIYHDGSNSYIADEGTGGIIMSGGTLNFQNQARDETHATMTVNGAVELYHNNVKKIETTSSGVNVTGNVVSNDGSNNARFQFDNNNQILIENDSAMNFYVNGNNNLKIDSAGHVTKPLQPAFLATNTNATQSSFAVGALVDVVFGVEVFDQNADFASNTFTAPITGRYQFNVNCRLDDMDSAANYYIIRLVTSNRNYTHIWDSNEFSSDTNYFTLQVSCLADMDASDTAKVIVYQDGGTQQTAVINASYFSGYLVA